MISHSESLKLAEILFPEVTKSIEEISSVFPSRNNIITTRFAPSPTGFLHIGGLYSAYVGEKFAHQNGGVFILRIEDTDQKRQKDDGIANIIEGLKKFHISIDEGPEFGGSYGPYIQSERKDIYSIFAKDLVTRNLAYPCFMSEEEIQKVRDEQVEFSIPSGIYGEYSPWSGAEYSEIMQKLENKEPYVLRFRAQAKIHKRVTVYDEIHGEIETQDNYIDIVLLKTDGIPTYHFAHIVDDYLMRTTHVIRGDEWIPSLPLHIQLFEAFGITPPKYVHMAPLMKVEDGNKRKLSKRKDPEANVEYFFEQGFPIECIKDYLLNILDSNYDQLRLSQSTNRDDFMLDFLKMPKSGALFDLKKLESISHQHLSGLSNDELFHAMQQWAHDYDIELYELIQNHKDLCFMALSIQRHTEKDPKKFRKFSDARPYLSQFIPELFAKNEVSTEGLQFEKTLVQNVLADFLDLLDKGHFTQDGWLNEIKEHSHEKFGVARDNQEWKSGNYALKFSDYIMIIRYGIVRSEVSPDLREMIRVLGKNEVKARVENFIDLLK